MRRISVGLVLHTPDEIAEDITDRVEDRLDMMRRRSS